MCSGLLRHDSQHRKLVGQQYSCSSLKKSRGHLLSSHLQSRCIPHRCDGLGTASNSRSSCQRYAIRKLRFCEVFFHRAPFAISPLFKRNISPSRIRKHLHEPDPLSLFQFLCSLCMPSTDWVGSGCVTQHARCSKVAAAMIEEK
jgi:hypothetical protein